MNNSPFLLIISIITIIAFVTGGFLSVHLTDMPFYEELVLSRNVAGVAELSSLFLAIALGSIAAITAFGLREINRDIEELVLGERERARGEALAESRNPEKFLSGLITTRNAVIERSKRLGQQELESTPINSENIARIIMSNPNPGSKESFLLATAVSKVTKEIAESLANKHPECLQRLTQIREFTHFLVIARNLDQHLELTDCYGQIAEVFIKDTADDKFVCPISLERLVSPIAIVNKNGFTNYFDLGFLCTSISQKYYNPLTGETIEQYQLQAPSEQYYNEMFNYNTLVNNHQLAQLVANNVNNPQLCIDFIDAVNKNLTQPNEQLLSIKTKAQSSLESQSQDAAPSATAASPQAEGASRQTSGENAIG